MTSTGIKRHRVNLTCAVIISQGKKSNVIKIREKERKKEGERER